jgi:protein SCO1/2
MGSGAGLQVPQRGRPLAPRRVAILLLSAALVGMGVGVALHFLLVKARPATVHTAGANAGGTALHGQATWPTGARVAPMITTLRDQNGRRFSLAALRGRTVAMTFFDSHCTQACPLAGRALATAERQLPGPQRPVLVVVSVNPLDTPASTRAAARKWGLAQVAAWHWLRGTHAQLMSIWKAYRIFVAPPRNGDISHTEALYLIDRRGYERSGYVYPFVPRFVTLDLRALAGEPRGRAG